MKPLAQIEYTNTNKEESFLKPLKPDMGYVPSSSEKETITNVLKRFMDMKSARTRIDTDWQLWKKISESKYYPYADGRTRVNVPVLRALQELFVAEATSRKIDKDIQPVWLTDVDKAEITKMVWDYEWNKNNRDEAMTDAEYKCSEIWTCAYMTGFEQSSRIINDPVVEDDGTISYTKKLMQQGKIILRTLDIRNVYFDDRVTCFDDANDEVYVEYITPEQFKSEKDNPNLKNTQYVWTTSKIDQVYFTWEDLGKQNTWLIEKLHYWNKQADKYIIIYNRSILARETPIPYSHKELPIVPRQYGKVVDSIYGRGLAEACMQFLDKINRLSEMLFDWIARSNNSIFAMWNWLTFDWNKFSFNNQLLKFNWQLNDANFREIKGIPPNQAAFTYLQDLLKEIAIYIGIDINWIIGQPSSTAFETAIRTESSLKRVNVVLSNRDYALQKVFKLHLANLMQFFPISEAERICEVSAKWEIQKPKEKTYPKIIMEGKKYVPETWKIVEEPWKFEFECKPEYIRGQVDITVKTNFSAPTLKSLKQESMNNFLKAYSLYSQMSLADPNLAKLIKPDDFIKELAFTYDVDINAIGWFSDSISKQKDQIMSLVRQMAGVEEWQSPLAWIWWPTGDPIPWNEQQQPMTPNLEQKQLPNVTTPSTPSINNLNPAEKAIL
jgi:hypothetical protein